MEEHLHPIQIDEALNKLDDEAERFLLHLNSGDDLFDSELAELDVRFNEAC